MSAPGSADILEAKPWSDVHLESAQNTPVDWNLCKVSSSEHEWLENSSLVYTILYSGKLSREKTSTNFTVLWLLAKLFSLKFGSMVSFSAAKASNPWVSSIKIVFFTNSQKFSPSKVSVQLTAVKLSTVQPAGERSCWPHPPEFQGDSWAIHN